MLRSAITLSLVLITQFSIAQNSYSNFSSQTNRLQTLTRANPETATLVSIGKTPSGKDIWMITIGKGNTGDKPAIAVIGGVEGNHLLGTELAISFAEKMAADRSDSVNMLLQRTTFYVFPNMSPDATEQYFAPLKFERMGNAAETDDDRDGKLNEDGYEDLDGNGKITMMRIVSPIGDYRSNPEDMRTLVKADLTKGERGEYIIMTEGIDNDKDGNYNEDGPGGVAFNKNLTHRYPPFIPGSGEVAVSEPESRALLDQLYKLFNVYAVVSFSSNNNLSSPQTYNAAGANQRIVTSYTEQDAKINAMVSDMYNKTTGMKDAPKVTPAGGDLLSWAYFHYGRLSFSTPAWFIPKPKADTTKKEKAPAISDSISAYLKWASAGNKTAGYTEWKKIDHPDFPGQVVEVGGPDPFALVNPPADMISGIAATHTSFITKLAWMQPQVDIKNVRTEKLGNGVTRITATVMNTGVLPSHTRLGEKSYWVKRIGVKLNTGSGQSILSGRKIQLLNSMEGLTSRELTWLVRGTGSIELEAGSPTTGTKKIDIRL